MGTLTFKTIEALRDHGRFPDGAGLYLLVSKTGAKSWLLRIQRDGRRRDLGLGGYPAVSLADARAAAAAMKASVVKGADPTAEKRKRKLRAALPSFSVAAQDRYDEVAKTFRNEKHKTQWINSLKTYAFPTIGRLPVDQVTPAGVRDALLPIWLEKPETARRVLQRTVDVLVWAVAKGYRADVPLMTAKALRLPKQPRADRHFDAMPWQDVPGFLSRLQAGDDGSEQTRLALELLILTASRSGELRGMTWSEVDMAARTWTIPAARMKAKRPHIVPLSARALEILTDRQARRVEASDLVFPGRTLTKAQSDMTLKMALRRMKLDHDPHGFRSSFRDWVSDATSFPSELAEAALAHIKGNKTEAAYARSTMLEKRRVMMEAWAGFVTGAATAGNVVRLDKAQRT
jgi:integrase